jgi:hypothetical protein
MSKTPPESTITRETLLQMQRAFPTIPWQPDDLDGLLELLQHWFPRLAMLDQLALQDIRPFPPHRFR